MIRLAKDITKQLKKISCSRRKGNLVTRVAKK